MIMSVSFSQKWWVVFTTGVRRGIIWSVSFLVSSE